MLTIKNNSQQGFPLLADDVRDGHIYMAEDGEIYIGNSTDRIVAFGVSGNRFIYERDDVKLIEIDADLVIKNL